MNELPPNPEATQNWGTPLQPKRDPYQPGNEDYQDAERTITDAQNRASGARENMGDFTPEEINEILKMEEPIDQNGSVLSGQLNGHYVLLVKTNNGQHNGEIDNSPISLQYDQKLYEMYNKAKISHKNSESYVAEAKEDLKVQAALREPPGYKKPE